MKRALRMGLAVVAVTAVLLSGWPYVVDVIRFTAYGVLVITVVRWICSSPRESTS